MHVHYEELSDVARYIETHSHITLEDQKPTLENVLSCIKRFKTLDHDSTILEIGVGCGFFQIYCKQQVEGATEPSLICKSATLKRPTLVWPSTTPSLPLPFSSM